MHSHYLRQGQLHSWKIKYLKKAEINESKYHFQMILQMSTSKYVVCTHVIWFIFVAKVWVKETTTMLNFSLLTTSANYSLYTADRKFSKNSWMSLVFITCGSQKSARWMEELYMIYKKTNFQKITRRFLCLLDVIWQVSEFTLYRWHYFLLVN